MRNFIAWSYDIVAKHVHYKAPMYNGLVVEVEKALREEYVNAYEEAIQEVIMDLLDVQEKTVLGNPKSADAVLSEVLDLCNRLRRDMRAQFNG